MNWILFALLSALVFAIVTVLDKLLVSSFFQDSIIFSLFIRGFSVTSAAIIILISGAWKVLPLPAMAWALASGVAQVIAWGFYFKAISQANASWVAAFSEARPLVTTVLGLVFLSEWLLPLNYLGVVAIMTGTILLSVERSNLVQEHWRWGKSVGIMSISVIANGFVSLFIRIGLEGEDPNNVFFWQQASAACTALILFAIWPDARARLKKMLKPVVRKAYVASFGVEFLAAVAGVLSVYSLVTGPLGPAIAVGTTTPLFVPVIIWAMNSMRPKMIAIEKQKLFLPWWLAFIIIAVGVYLVSIKL